MNIVDADIHSFQSALASVFEFVPRLFGFLVILLVGWLMASALTKSVTFLLRKVGFDRIGQQVGIQTDAAAIPDKPVYWFIFLTFLVPAINALGLNIVSDLLGRMGGQETARKYLGRTESATSSVVAQVQTQQSMNQARTLPPTLEVLRAR
ncbi:MAG: hypothetical protein PVS3B3_13450 [Ktedonobacteraceae bacterium]